ncbi:hypothetical protein [Halomonas sp. H5]|uniref:hypothetical protein n=1 Tax=Halomonas sp. H5 TaxID=3423910 RepID=UPI003D35E8E2
MATKFFDSYQDAADLARKLAIKHKVVIKIKRSTSGFAVEIPFGSDVAVYAEDKSCFDSDCGDFYSYSSSDDYDRKETLEEINSELLEFSDSMQRSIEKGWFYDDSEGGWEDNVVDPKYE